MGEPAWKSGDRAEILVGPRNGGDGGCTQGVSCSRCSLRGIPEPSNASRQEARPGCGPGGAERGKRVMPRQMYKIKQEIADHDRVALEVEWVGTLAVPYGSIPAGGADEGLFCRVSGVPRREDHQVAQLRLFRGLVANTTGKWGS